MSPAMSFSEMVSALNERLGPHGYALVEHPAQAGKVVLTHPDLEAMIKARAFLNHGLTVTSDSGVVLGRSPKRGELVLERTFEVILTLSVFDPDRLVAALLKAGQDLLENHRQFIASSNPLHRKLLEYREAITKAGFHLEPTHFVANLETRRQLTRITRDRADQLDVAIDPQGDLVATHLQCAFSSPIPFTTALKVMGLGLPKD